MVTWPSSKKNPWEPDTMPVSQPYITASVYLTKNPLTKYNEYDVIKSQCNNVFCSFNKTKYDHDFYLQYNSDTGRWTKTLPSIKSGNVRVYISGFYRGYSEKDDNNKVYHGIQLTELDFEPKYNKNTDDNDSDDFFFPSTSKKSSQKKHNLSESSESSSSDVTQGKKKKRKSAKKTKANPTTDQPVKLKQELSYEELPAIQAISKLDKSESHSRTKEQNASPAQYNPYYDHGLPPPPQQPYHYYPRYYYPPPHSSRSSFNSLEEFPKESDKADKKVVQFNLPDEENNNNVIESPNNKRRTRGKRGRKSKGGPVRKSPRRKGILNIAVDKVVESDDQQKSDSFMDTESDYQTQNDEETNDDASN